MKTLPNDSNIFYLTKQDNSVLRFKLAYTKQVLHSKHAMKNVIQRYLLILASTLFLAACGSDFGTACGAKTQVFGINFEKNAYSGSLGEELKIETELIPETCRADMSFSIKFGELPPGMAIVEGNIFGTPTTAGEYEFKIYITAVKNYGDLKQYIESGLIDGPFSNKIKLTIR